MSVLALALAADVGSVALFGSGALFGSVTLLGSVAFVAVAILHLAPSKRSVRRFVSEYGLFVLFAGFVVLAVALFLTKGEQFFRDMLAEYGLYVLFGIFILEGAMLLYFAPSESLVPIAVATMADSMTDYAVIIGVAVVGATIGQYFLFRVAKRGGREYLLEKPWFRVGDDKLARLEGWFDRWGPVVVPVSNTLLFTRGMLTVPAGFAEMDDREFLALSALGTLSFEVILAALALGVIELL